MSLIALVTFIALQILFIPLAIIGILLVTYKQLWVSRRVGVSQTAVEVINGRWAMDIFGIRQDRATAQLAAALPNDSIFGLWLVLFPLYVYYKISGKNWLYPTVAERGAEGVANLIINRTLYFDEIINKVQYDVEQFVVMGAGFDTRCYGALKEWGLALFELDQSKIQQLKRDCLAKAQIDTSHVHFVEVDFSTELWSQKLLATDYDPQKRTLFLWEGVTLV
ncbi:MAG: class I SAM-dependent methyltransferase [Chloroflexota bacterium]